MAAHLRLKNVFTEDEKYDNLMTWLIYFPRVHIYCFTKIHIKVDIIPDRYHCIKLVQNETW